MTRHPMAGAIALAFVVVLATGAAVRGPTTGTADPRVIPVAARCFATGASKVIGIDRICYYRCGPATVTTIAVPATDLCPDFIDR